MIKLISLVTTPLNPVKEEEPQKPDEPPPKSATHESLAHVATIGASLTSSGYGSQTVSGAQSEDSLHSPILTVVISQLILFLIFR